jgi:tol-pal system protein YbgF
MTRTFAAATVAIAILLPHRADAANKEHQQIMAELRMLQEQQAQLLLAIGNLNDTVKGLSSKIEEQGGAARKAFADQRLLIEGVGETARVLREKADDTNVRLSTMTHELEALRQTIASMPAQSATPSVPPGGVTDPSAPGSVPSTAPPSTAPPTTTLPPPNVSPQRMYDAAYADYTGGQFELAVEGFQQYIKMFPRTEKTDDAQLNIGNALYAAGKSAEAVEAYRRVISDYPQSDSVPSAWYKLGLTYEAQKQVDLARKAFETVVKNFPNDVQTATLAKQALDRLNRR